MGLVGDRLIPLPPVLSGVHGKITLMLRKKDGSRAKPLRYKFSNDYHETTASVPSSNGKLTRQRVDRLKRQLCQGNSECTCSGTGGVRGPQKWKLVDRPGGAATIMRANGA